MENDFVMTVVHERIEGEIFWKWFSFQVSLMENLYACIPKFWQIKNIVEDIIMNSRVYEC